MEDIIETSTVTIATRIGIWVYARNLLLQRGLQNTGANQYALLEWLKENDAGTFDSLDYFLPQNMIVIAKDQYNTGLVLRGIRLFGTKRAVLFSGVMCQITRVVQEFILIFWGKP